MVLIYLAPQGSIEVARGLLLKPEKGTGIRLPINTPARVEAEENFMVIHVTPQS